MCVNNPTDVKEGKTYEDAYREVEKMIEGTIRMQDYSEYYVIPKKEWDGR